METTTIDSTTQKRANVAIYWGIAVVALAIFAIAWAMQAGSRNKMDATGSATSSSSDSYQTQDSNGTATSNPGTSNATGP